MTREPLHVLGGGYDSPLRRGVYLLPNLVTTGGLFAGFYSVISTFAGHYELAAVMILIAHLFDGLDGRIDGHDYPIFSVPCIVGTSGLHR